MNEQELQELVEKISLEVFGLPFVDKAVFNTRLRTTGGRFVFLRTRGSKKRNLDNLKIELNPVMLEEHGKEVFFSVIRHELAHYHLFRTGGNFQENSRQFQSLLKKVNALKFAPPTPSKKSVSKHLYIYRCAMGHEITRKRKIDTKRYVCAKDKTNFVLVQELNL